MINIIAPTRYRIGKKRLRPLIFSIMEKCGIAEKTLLNIVFVGKRKMKEIALKYKKEDVALPVLAFPYKDITIEGEELIGEIFLCYPQVVLLAAEREKRVEETILKLIDHGIQNILSH